MTKDALSNITWQKVTLVVTVAIIALPGAVKIGWNLIFPKDLLLYEFTSSVQSEDFQTKTFTITNPGNGIQKNVTMEITSNYGLPKKAILGVTEAERIIFSSSTNIKLNKPIKEFISDDKLIIPIGEILPEEKVQVAIHISKKEDSQNTNLIFDDLKIKSLTTIAEEADGIRYPIFGNSPHMFFRSFAYLVGVITLIGLVIFIIVGSIVDTFFETDEKKMTRLWRQMDKLQEKIDKEKRYL